MDEQRIVEAAQAFCERIERTIEPLLAKECRLYACGANTVFAHRVAYAREVLQTLTSMPEASKEKIASELERFIKAPHEGVFDDKLAHFTRTAAISLTQTLCNAWGTAIREAVTHAGGQVWLRLITLDDAMMPRNNAPAMQAFGKAIAVFGKGTLTTEEGLGYLRVVRASLAEGETFPEEAVRLLEASDVMVIR